LKKKKIKIVVTGAKGFIASNLISHLQNNNKYEIFKVVKNTKENILKDYLLKSHYIFHLAGENRPLNKKLFKKNNELFTKKICEILIKNKIKSKFIYISSTQAPLRTAYGFSKLNSENIVKKFSRKNKSQVCIIRLANVFGKWARPNYNSFVATLCHRIPINKSFFVKNNIINLIYIDDVVKGLIGLLNRSKLNLYEKITPIYKMNIMNIVNLIKKFNSEPKNLYVDDLGSGFKKKIYSTFLSFLPKKNWFYKIKNNSDKRGKFLEFTKTTTSGQISLFSINPFQTRGNHYHHTKNEKFYIFNGKIKILLKNILTNKRYEVIQNSKDSKVFRSIPGWAHTLKNLTSNTIYGVVWSNEIFNKKKPDTIKELL